MEIDRQGLKNAYVTCGTIMDAMSAMVEDLEKWQHPQVTPWLGLLTEAAGLLSDAESNIREFLDYMTECAVCDGIIGAAPRAEVVNKAHSVAADYRPHLIIHQSCFREADHEIA